MTTLPVKAGVAGAVARAPDADGPLASTGGDLFGLFLLTLLLAGNGVGGLVGGARRERSHAPRARSWSPDSREGGPRGRLLWLPS
jgi:hypothetical protein